MSNFNPEQLLPSEFQGQKPTAIMNVQGNKQQRNALSDCFLNLYFEPIPSVVREIISNAIHATKLLPAAQRQPIDIHLPSKQELFFAVTDHATGMSPQEVKHIYLNYGIDSETSLPQIGGCGLGAKAPLSYTQTFVVTTVKDQQETTCIMNLQQAQLYTKKTTAANGTRVKIPLSQEQDIDKFYAAVKTYAIMPVPGIQFAGLQSVQKEISPYGKVIPCGTIQVDQKSLPVYWHCTVSSKHMSDRGFFYVFSWTYTTFKHHANDLDYLKQNFFVSAALDGFRYPLSSSQNLQAVEFIIEIQPGMVNFGYTPESIIPDSKKRQLWDDFFQQISTSFINTIQTIGLRNLVNAQKPQPQALQPFRSQIVDNALDFYQLCRDSQHSAIIDTPHADLSLGLIVDSQPATEVIANFGQEILKIIFLFQAKINLQVNLYQAATFNSSNMKQIQQQNDLILSLHHFTRKNVQYYVSKFNLPIRKITLSNHTPDVLLLLLYWSQMLETQVDLEDYEDLRLPLEKLLKLSLVQQDAPLNYPFTNILDDFQLLYPVFKNNFQTGKLPVQSVYTEQEMRWIKQVTNKP